jgi:hypothetical protein
MKKPVGCILKALAISVVSTSVHAAVIGFEGIGAHGAQFATYTEDGFTVTAGSTLWTNNRVYGAPAPFVQYYRNKEDPEIVTGLFVSADGADFTFASVDVYSSVTPIPYRVRGYQDSAILFDFFGTVPNTFGQFRTVINPGFPSLIDRLYIQLWNPYVALGGNPVGMDNITVSMVSAVPEPSALLLLGAGLAWVGWNRRRA